MSFIPDAGPAATPDASPCPLCANDGGRVLWRTEKLRVVAVDDADYPGFCRVIWNHHAREMTDLAAEDRSALMQVVCCVEQGLREMMEPDKINLASLGNVVPHVHWHVIPRWRDDRHFPDPIWAAARREAAHAHSPHAEQLARAARLDVFLPQFLNANLPW